MTAGSSVGRFSSKRISARLKSRSKVNVLSTSSSGSESPVPNPPRARDDLVVVEPEESQPPNAPIRMSFALSEVAASRGRPPAPSPP
jgi:hypothetical protein